MTTLGASGRPTSCPILVVEFKRLLSKANPTQLFGQRSNAGQETSASLTGSFGVMLLMTDEPTRQVISSGLERAEAALNGSLALLMNSRDQFEDGRVREQNTIGRPDPRSSKG
jgi:hypothetical protein